MSGSSSSLRSARVLEESGEADCSSVTSLRLSHRALSDVSCLAEFTNLTKLDLKSNNLSSLEGLRFCTNLTWLSVVENKLDSLKGVECLLKLKVLNAGHNRLASIYEVNPLSSLQALILNDNQISSIKGVEKLKQLHALVLSRNPINDVGDSIQRLKSLTKLSIANCGIKKIGDSLKYCADLKELRLAHNEITALPTELSRNSKLEIIDLGDNLIANWSDIEVLSSLSSVKNLNLLGNPISEKNKWAKKIKKLVPNLQILNSKPLEAELKKSVKRQKIDSQTASEFGNEEAIAKKKVPSSGNGIHENDAGVDDMLQNNQSVSGITDKNIVLKSKLGKEGKRKEQKDLESAGIDDCETPFVDIIFTEDLENLQDSGKKRKNTEISKNAKSVSGVVSISHSKKKKSKSSVSGIAAVQSLLVNSEIGLGGPSSWGD